MTVIQCLLALDPHRSDRTGRSISSFVIGDGRLSIVHPPIDFVFYLQ